MMIGIDDNQIKVDLWNGLTTLPSVLNGELAPGMKGEGMSSQHEDETLRLSGEKSVMQIMSDMNVRKKWMTRCFRVGSNLTWGQVGGLVAPSLDRLTGGDL